jgi:hypothetical protein
LVVDVILGSQAEKFAWLFCVPGEGWERNVLAVQLSFVKVENLGGLVKVPLALDLRLTARFEQSVH